MEHVKFLEDEDYFGPIGVYKQVKYLFLGK